MREIRKVFSYAKEYRHKIYYAIMLATISVAASIIPYYLVYTLIAKFLSSDSVMMLTIIRVSALILLCLILQAVSFYLAMRFSHHVAFDTLLGMRHRMADKMIKMPMGEIHKKSSGQFKQIFVDLTEDMEAIIAHLIPEGISNTVVPIAVIVYLFIIDWRMALLTLAIVPIALYIFKRMMRGRMKKLSGYLQASQHMNENIVEFISGMEVIKMFNQTTSSFNKYTYSVKNYKRFTLDWSNDSWPSLAAFYVVLPCTVLFSLPIGTIYLMDGTITLETYILCLLLGISLGTPLLRLTEFGTTFQMVTQKSKMIDEIFQMDELDISKSSQVSPSSYHVAFEDVTFAYDQKDVIKDISFHAKENTVTALVGPSGSGKSTIAKLLVRFWDVKKGKITIGGMPINEMCFETLMDTMSYVSQDIHLFQTSIMENIRMGKGDATDDEVIKAAKLAQCHDFIIQTEKGYDTNIGDGGNKLSGGQKQRLSIARALLKNAPIIVLDEATAFTDPENEDKIQEGLNELIQGKTLFIIAHRLSTIREADNIIVLNNGKISSMGTHEQLMKDSTLYQKMWQAHAESMNWNIHVKEASSHA